jgi:hypothetical protein
MSAKSLLHEVLSFAWLGEADAAAGRLVKALAVQALRWRWRLAGVAGVALVFLVPLTIFALTPAEQDVLRQHEALEDAALAFHQQHERNDLAHNPHSAATVRQLQLHQLQERQQLQLHQAQLQALPDGALFLPPDQLPLQASLQQQELQTLGRLWVDRLHDARQAGLPESVIQRLRHLKLQEFRALVAYFNAVNAVSQASPHALRDLNAFDPLLLRFFPHSDHDYDDGNIKGNVEDSLLTPFPGFFVPGIEGSGR